MSDFPTTLGHPNHVSISATDQSCLVGQCALCTNGTVAAGTWPTANTCVYIPFMVEVPFIVKNAAVRVSVQAGNLDIGIYSEGGVALVTKGVTAVAVAGLQVVDLSASISLGAASPLLGIGTYYFGMNCSSTTASFFRLGNTSAAGLRTCGVRMQAVGATALPANATFAVMSNATIPEWLLSNSTIL